MKSEKGYKNLVVWQRADELAKEVYMATRSFPKEEIYGITSQLRRAVLSVPINIVEGYSRQSKKELRQFINISLASLAEVEYIIDFSLRIGYLKEKDYERLEELRNITGKLLWGFYKSIK